MDFHSIKDDMQVDLLLLDADGDNETLTSTGVDMAGYQGAFFLAAFGKGEAAAVTMKLQQDSASNFGTAADLLDTSVAMTAATATHGFAGVEIKHPRERYVRAALVIPNIGVPRPACVICIRYGAKYRPETNSDVELHVNPAEGTA